MASPQYSGVTIYTRTVQNVHYCHNCGVVDDKLYEVKLFGLKFYLCDSCYKEFQETQSKHSCPALNSDWYV